MKIRNVILGVLAAALMLPVFAMSVNAKETYVEINATNFPDSDFRTYITNLEKNQFSYNKSFNGDGKLSVAEIKTITYISPTPYKDMESVKGIEYFTSLKTAELWGCPKLKSIDLSKNTQLTTVNAYNSPITSIDVSKCTNLQHLDIHNTKISSLDISNCPGLSYLDISDNTNLKTKVSIMYNNNLIYAWYKGTVTKQTSSSSVIETYTALDKVLKYSMLGSDYGVYANVRKINAVNFPDATFRDYIKQFDLNIDDVLSPYELERVRTIDISYKNVSSVKGIEFFKKLNKLIAKSCNISSVDLSQNTVLTEIYLNSNNLTEIDLSKQTQLYILNLSNNKIQTIDLSKNSDLWEFNIGENELSSIDLTNNTRLKDLNIYDNNLTSLDVSKNTQLELIRCENNKLTNLDMSKCIKLEDFYCYNNPLTSLDVTKNVYLSILVCTGTQITSIDVSKCKYLGILVLYDNKLSSLDVRNNTKLWNLIIDNNSISSIDLSCNTNLSGFSASNNKLTSINVSNCPKLNELRIDHNNITSVDVRNMSDLEYLWINSNNITSIDLSGTDLRELNCSNTLISSLDLSKTPNIYQLFCENTSISSLNLSGTIFNDKQMNFRDYNGCFYCYEDGNDSDVNNYLIGNFENLNNHTFLSVNNKVILTNSKTTPPTPVTTPVPTPAPTGNSSNPGTGSTGSAGSTTPVNIDAKKVDGFAERLYTKCLNRASDPNGKLYWISQLKAGVSGADVAKQFFYSPEFVGFGLNDQEYVTRLYRTFMDREPDQTGMDFWLSKLAEGKGRDYVFYGFVNSTEWANICLEYGIVSGGTAKPTISRTPSPETIAFATRLYTTCMCRPADAAGVDYWAKELANMRRSGTQVAYEFFFSKEFIDYGVSDDEYINRLYQTFMGRAADSAGFAYWQGELKNSDRKTVLYRFAGCQEFADICSAAGIIR